MQVRLAAVGAVALAIAGGCEDSDYCVPLEAEPVDPAGAHHDYVIATINLPSYPSEVDGLGLDLDGDRYGRPDNALGYVAKRVFDLADLDPDDEVNALVRDGAILHLLDLQATSLEDASGVGFTVRHGLDRDGDPSDNFSGSEDFEIDVSRGSGTISGAIAEGRLSASVGTLPVAITFPGLGESFVVHLIGARAEVLVRADRLSGRIGGAVTTEEVDAVLFPVFAEGLTRVMEADCDASGCAPGSGGDTVSAFFDDNGDGVIGVDELRENDLAQGFAAPDMDLLDEDGELNPLCDGVKDSLSVGLGFSAVPAVVVRD